MPEEIVPGPDEVHHHPVRPLGIGVAVPLRAHDHIRYSPYIVRFQIELSDLHVIWPITIIFVFPALTLGYNNSTQDSKLGVLWQR
jgi:hypothetical protein